MSGKKKIWQDIAESEDSWEIKELISYLQEIAKGIEDGTYEDIRVQPCVESFYDDTWAQLEIRGCREETDDEYEVRRKREEVNQKLKEKKDCQEFERLKEKYT